jgi:signal transduction histidine kinase/ActR/RegA family two-component response regulator
MPDMDGFETASMIHQHPRFEKTPIIFVSAVNVSDMDRLRGYKLGAVDYVMVPIIPEILRSKVMVLAELFRKRNELLSLNASLALANAELAAANAALQAEKAREVNKLNDSLSIANIDLAETNRSLQQEVAERRNVEERLRNADRRKDEFLATLAHELRNPLAPIQSALNVRRLAPATNAEGDNELHELMERHMRQLVRLVDDLLDISRITRDRLTLRLERAELGKIIQEAVETVQPMLREARQTVRIELPEDSVHMYVDPHRLAQVFANLLSNASKYSETEATVDIRATIAADTVAVSVRDTGIGLDANQLNSIFEIFTQVDTSLQRSHGGLGIGLTLARRLVEMHGGTIAASSAGLGHGSEFMVTLPIRVADELGEDRSPAETVTVGTAERALRILVIDDNRDSADMLSLSLKIMGHEVLTLYDPVVVVDAAIAFQPSLVFMDIGMPMLNGFALATRLREQQWPSGRCPRLVALTGWGQEEDRRKSQEAGFDEHLVKPADLETIVRVCQTAALRPEKKK